MSRARAASFALWLLTVLVMLAALPAFAAPQKTFSYRLTVPAEFPEGQPNPQYAPVGAEGTQFVVGYVQFTLRNESPPSVGNANIGSFRFTVFPWLVTEVAECPAGATCSRDGSTVTVTSISPPIQAQQEVTVTLKVSTCGDGRVVDFPIVHNGSQLTGQTFAPAGNIVKSASMSCGDLACGQDFVLNDIVGRRGQFNIDGSCGVVEGYFVTNTLPFTTLPPGEQRRLHFEWDIVQQPRAAFVYAADVPTGANLLFSWRDDESGNPVFVTAQSCDLPPPSPLDALPSPYGTLITNVNRTGTSINVNVAAGVTLPAPPFRIVIESERLLVTSVSGSNWTVQRAVDGTQPAAHSAGTRAMRTHLPAIATPPPAPSPYANDFYARMCVVAVDPLDADTTTVWVLDGGDGWLSLQ